MVVWFLRLSFSKVEGIGYLIISEEGPGPATGLAGSRIKRRVYYADLAVLLPVVEVFRVDNAGSQGLGGSENRRVPIRNREALRELDGYLYQLAVYGLAWKCRRLLNPLQGLGGREGRSAFLTTVAKNSCKT